MKGICSTCNRIFTDTQIKFQEAKVKKDIIEVYYKCPHCKKKYTCFYTDKEIRRLQAKQRATKDVNEFNKLKEEVTKRMNELKRRMKGING